MSTEKYDDIIELPHHLSPTRTHMSMRERAAQFAPFSALVGYDDMVEETARQTDDKIDIDEYGVFLIDRKLRILKDNEDTHPLLEITYFIPDGKKKGGRHETVREKLLRIDEFEKRICLSNGDNIYFNRISAISSLLFSDEI